VYDDDGNITRYIGIGGTHPETGTVNRAPKWILQKNVDKHRDFTVPRIRNHKSKCGAYEREAYCVYVIRIRLRDNILYLLRTNFMKSRTGRRAGIR